MLSEDEGQNYIVVQCRLPFSFKILSKLPPRQKCPIPRRGDGEPRDDVAPEIPPGNGQIHHPALDIGNKSAPQGREAISSKSLPLLSLVQPAGSAGGSSAQLHAISPPKTDGERPPTLTEVNPDSGSITGGVRIWLKGIDFPALLPLFARFGAAVVPTVRTWFYLSRSISSCLLEFLFFQPSCLSFASHKQPRRHQCYAIEASATKRTRVWNQYRDIQIQRGSRGTVRLLNTLKVTYSPE